MEYEKIPSWGEFGFMKFVNNLSNWRAQLQFQTVSHFFIACINIAFKSGKERYLKSQNNDNINDSNPGTVMIR